MKGWYNLAQSCNKNTSPEKMIHVNWKKQGWRLLENGAQWLVHKLINLNQFDAHVRTIFFLTTIGFFAFWYNGKQFGAKDNRDPQKSKSCFSLYCNGQLAKSNTFTSLTTLFLPHTYGQASSLHDLQFLNVEQLEILLSMIRICSNSTLIITFEEM